MIDEEVIEHNKRWYGGTCELCNDFIIVDQESPNYEGKKLYKRDHTVGRDTRRLIVCEECLYAEPCAASLSGVHRGPVVELNDDLASHFFDSNPDWYWLSQTARGKRRTLFALCPGCEQVLYWSVERQRFVDMDLLSMAVTLDDLSGKFDLDMTRIPMGTIAYDMPSTTER